VKDLVWLVALTPRLAALADIGLVDFAGDVALEAADDLFFATARPKLVSAGA
jgi:hypothetical protein